MDYNIYIHDKTGGSQKPTKPRQQGESKPTSPKVSESSSGQGGSGLGVFKKVKEFIKDDSAGGGYGTALAIYITALKVAYKITTRVLDTVEPLVVRETGDYRWAVAYENIKTGIGMVTSPLRTGFNLLTNNRGLQLANKKQEQERLLLGDSVVNTVSRKV